jgi:hypothetical protein
MAGSIDLGEVPLEPLKLGPVGVDRGPGPCVVDRA